MATDFLPSPSEAPSNRSKTLTPVISFLSAPAAARRIVAASTELSTTKAKSRRTVWNGESSSGGRVCVAFLFGSGVRREDLEAAERPGHVEGFQRLRVKLAEMAEHDLRPELDRARAARVIPVRAAAFDLQLVRRQAAGFQHGEGVGLGVEDADGLGGAVPVTAGTGQRCRAAADAAGDAALRSRACRPRRCRTPRRARRRRSPCRHCAGRRRAGPAAATGACRTCRRRSGWQASAPAPPPPKASAWAAGMKDQVTASSMPRAASARLAARVRICSGVRILPLTAPWLGERLRLDPVDAVDAHHLLDEVGLAVDVRAPARHGDGHRLAAAFRPRSRGGRGSRGIRRPARKGPSGASPRRRGTRSPSAGAARSRRPRLRSACRRRCR